MRLVLGESGIGSGQILGIITRVGYLYVLIKILYAQLEGLNFVYGVECRF